VHARVFDNEYNAVLCKYIQNLHETGKERHYISDSQSMTVDMGVRGVCDEDLSELEKIQLNLYSEDGRDFESKLSPA